MIKTQGKNVKIVMCFMAAILINMVSALKAQGSSADLDSISPNRSIHFTTSQAYPWTASYTSGVWVAKCGNTGVASSTSSLLASVSVPQGAEGEISFTYRVSSEQNYDKLFVLVDGVAISDFSSGKSGTVSSTTCSVSLTPGSHSIEWYFTKDGSGNTGEDAAFISNVIFSVGYCPRPANVRLTSITSNSASIAWTGQSSTSIEYGTQNFVRGTGVSDFINDSTYSLVNLQPNTYYTIYLQSYCSSGDTSVWVSKTFRTACEPITTLPYTQNFDDWTASSSVSSTIDPCWNRLSNYSSVYSRYPYVTSGYSHSSSNSVYLYGYSSTYSMLVLPTFADTITHLQVSFWMYSYYTSATYAIQIGVMTDPNDYTTFTPIATRYTTQSSTWQYFEVPLNYYSGQGKYIAFKTGSNTYSCYIDDVTVDTIPSCPRPTSVSVSSISTTRATVSWSSTVATSWDVEYGTPGFPRGSGTTIHTSSRSCTLTGLSPATCYEVYITSNCGNGETNRSISTQFHTSCGDIATMPFVENFDGVQTGSMSNRLPCWKGGSNYSSSYPSITTNSGSNTLYMYAYRSSTGTAAVQYYDYFATPAIDTVANPLRNLQVSCRITRPYSYYSNQLAFGVMTDPNDVTTFDTLDIINPTTTGWFDYTYSFANYRGQGRYPAFKGMISTSTYGMYFYFDDFVIQEIPTCPEPTNLRASTTYDPDDIQISWTSAPAPATSWDIAYGKTGFSPYIEGQHIFGVTDTFYTLSGLSVDTTYDIYVRSNCQGESSMWNETPITLIPGTVQIPYSGTQTYYLCDAMVYDNGGSRKNYEPSSNGTVIIYPMTTDSVINISGNYATEATYDVLTIYDGAGTSGTVLARVSGIGTVNCTSTIGAVTLVFSSDAGVEKSGFNLHAQCVAPPDCRRPIPTVLSVSSRQAVIDVISSPANNWIVEYKTGSATFTPGRGLGTTFVAPSSNFTITGLQPQTTYKAYLRTDCGNGDTSDWSYIFTFSTPCDPDTIIPVVEDFTSLNNNTRISCWTHSGSYPMCRIWPQNTGNKTYILWTSVANTNNYMAIRKIEGFPLTSLRVKFSLFGTDTASIFNVGVMTNPSDYTSFTSVATFNVRDEYDWYNYEIPLSNYTGSDGFIAFSSVNPREANSVYFDNMYIDTMPSCQTPTDVTVRYSGNNLILSWNNHGSNSSIVEFGTRGFTLGTGSSYGVANSITINKNLFTPNTEYDFYVRSICSAGDTSDWVINPFRFVPRCESINLPYTEHFDRYVGTPYSNYKRVMPTCWNIVQTSAKKSFYHPQIIEDTNLSISGNYVLLLNKPSLVATPSINKPLDSVMTEFYMNVEDVNTGLVVGVIEDVNDPSTFIPVDTVYNTHTNIYQLQSVVFSNYNGNARNIAIKNINSTARDTMRVYIEDMEFMEIPQCVRPNNLVVSNITAHTVDVSWNERGNATSWILEYDTLGFTLGTGTSITVNTNNYTITGLDSNRTYAIYVRSICPTGDTSDWVTMPTEFTLPRCDESCFYTLNLSAISSGWYNAAIEVAYNGMNPIRYTLTTTSSETFTIIACPEEIVTFRWISGQNDSRCNFMLMYGSDTLYYSNGAPSEELFYTITCGSSMECPRPSNLTATDVDYQTVDLGWYGIGNFAIACQIANTNTLVFVDTIRTTNYVNVYRATSLDPDTTYIWRVRNLCYIDSVSSWEVQYFKISDIRCVEPINLRVDNATLTQNSAKVMWQSFENNQSWQLHCYSISNNFDTIYSLQDTTFTIRGLLSGVTYNAAVRGICNNSGTSVWSDTISFVTAVCDTVSGVSVSQITNTSALVSWDKGEQTRWELDYGTRGFPIGYGTTQPLGTNTYRLTNLSPGTTYDVYVRNVCGSNYYSVWSPRLRFTTTGTSGVTTAENNGVELTIIPNPTASTTTISIKGILGDATLTITDVNGRTLLKENYYCDGSLTYKLDVTKFAKGTYFVHLTNAQANMVQKLIVQ